MCIYYDIATLTELYKLTAIKTIVYLEPFLKELGFLVFESKKDVM